eukprot:TRINITY_DN827_c0_g1_i2.p1 TRINITY_DN827_c0_g1~~TRINITY_DN827_c0_g1_i2.p1  ORF type:complete len:331 (+),score=54.10 TRINITY_DN827_c0_g1_i2:64-1056(+)
MSGVSDRYVSSAHHADGVDDTLARMLGHEARAVPQTSPAFHQFGDKCTGCNQPIAGEFVTSHKGKFHSKCFNDEFFCERCRKPVIGEVRHLGGKDYHPRCFTCASCTKDVTGAFVDLFGSPYCKKCADEIQEARKRGGAVEVGRVTVGKAGPSPADLEKAEANRELSANIQKGKEMCSWCRKPMDALATAIKFEGKVFHEGCFSCAHCGETIGSGGFANRGGVAYCLSCSAAGGAASPVGKELCGGCNKPLSGHFLAAIGKKWHKECFVCSMCRGQLPRGYAERDGKPVCPKCAAASLPPRDVSFSKVDSGEPRRSGFTVDPRSGKKTTR